MDAWGKESALVYHDEYLKLDKDKDTRCYAYRELFIHQLSEYDIHLIENAEEYCQLVGDDRFRKEIEEKHEIKPGHMSCGRSKKKAG